MSGGDGEGEGGDEWKEGGVARGNSPSDSSPKSADFHWSLSTNMVRVWEGGEGREEGREGGREGREGGKGGREGGSGSYDIN